jgi:hypothetical protein
LSVKYPQVRGPFFGQWYIEETTGNRAYRPPAAYDLLPHYYLLRVLAGPSDPKIIGLRDPSNPAVMNKVKRPVESQ